MHPKLHPSFYSPPSRPIIVYHVKNSSFSFFLNIFCHFCCVVIVGCKKMGTVQDAPKYCSLCVSKVTVRAYYLLRFYFKS